MGGSAVASEAKIVGCTIAALTLSCCMYPTKPRSSTPEGCGDGGLSPGCVCCCQCGRGMAPGDRDSAAMVPAAMVPSAAMVPRRGMAPAASGAVAITAAHTHRAHLVNIYEATGQQQSNTT
eukprot:SAG25_NODE_6192_length_580_cov_0.962578_2_plen_121_part_00